MEDYAEGMPRPRTNSTNSMLHACPVGTFVTLDGPMLYREYDAVSMIYGNDLDIRLHSGSLPSQNKFATGKTLPWYVDREGDLDWKNKRTKKVEMRAIVVSGTVF